MLSQKSSKSSVVFSVSCFMLYNRIKLYANASKFILSSVFIIPVTTSFSIWNCSLNIPNGPSTPDLLAYSSLYSFATGWVGEFLFSPLPEFSYALILFIWSLSLELLDKQVTKENPDIGLDHYHETKIRIFEHIGFIIAMVVAFIEPILCITIIFLTVVITAIVIGKRNNDD